MNIFTKNTFKPLLTVASSFALAVIATPYLYALDFSVQGGADAVKGNGQPTEIFGDTGIFTTISNTLLFIIGALSVIMIIVGGLRYAISGGNATAVTAAKNTILYAIVGLIVALLAFAIINFVINTFIPGSSVGGTNT